MTEEVEEEEEGEEEEIKVDFKTTGQNQVQLHLDRLFHCWSIITDLCVRVNNSFTNTLFPGDSLLIQKMKTNKKKL